MAKTITRNKIGVEDLLLGRTPVIQTRGSASTTINPLDIPIVVDDAEAVSALDVTIYTRARFYVSNAASEYRYEAAIASGGLPSTGAGVWLLETDLVRPTEITGSSTLLPNQRYRLLYSTSALSNLVVGDGSEIDGDTIEIAMDSALQGDTYFSPASNSLLGFEPMDGVAGAGTDALDVEPAVSPNWQLGKLTDFDFACAIRKEGDASYKAIISNDSTECRAISHGMSAGDKFHIGRIRCQFSRDTMKPSHIKFTYSAIAGIWFMELSFPDSTSMVFNSKLVTKYMLTTGLTTLDTVLDEVDTMLKLSHKTELANSSDKSTNDASVIVIQGGDSVITAELREGMCTVINRSSGTVKITTGVGVTAMLLTRGEAIVGASTTSDVTLSQHSLCTIVKQGTNILVYTESASVTRDV